MTIFKRLGSFRCCQKIHEMVTRGQHCSPVEKVNRCSNDRQHTEQGRAVGVTRGHVELSERIEVIVGGVAGGRVFQAGWAGLDEVGGATGGEKQVLRGAQQDGRDVGPERE